MINDPNGMFKLIFKVNIVSSKRQHLSYRPTINKVSSYAVRIRIALSRYLSGN